jgi:hypothetical protein
MNAFVLPMTDGFSDVESALRKAECVRHSYSYVFRVLMRLSGEGDVLCVLKTHSSWVYMCWFTVNRTFDL